MLSQTQSNAAHDSQEHKGPELCGCDRRSAPVLLPTCNRLTGHFTRGPTKLDRYLLCKAMSICRSPSCQRPPELICTYRGWTPNAPIITRAPFCPAYTFRLSVCAQGTTETRALHESPQYSKYDNVIGIGYLLFFSEDPM